MQAVGVLLVLGGLFLICSPGGTVVFAWLAWRNYRKITSAIPILTCGQVSNLTGRLPKRVALEGRTPGSDAAELLRAPRSGADCVWHRLEHMQHNPPPDQEHVRRWITESSWLVEITDGTGTVSLTAELAGTSLLKMVGSGIAAQTAKGRDSAGDDQPVHWTEYVIRPDVPVFVVGKPSCSETGIVLEKGWIDPVGTSTLPGAQVRHRFTVRLIRAIALLFVLPALGLGLVGLSWLVVP